MLPNFFSVVIVHVFTVHIFTIHVSHVFGDFQIIGVRNYKLQQAHFTHFSQISGDMQQVYHTVLLYIIL